MYFICAGLKFNRGLLQEFYVNSFMTTVVRKERIEVILGNYPHWAHLSNIYMFYLHL